MHKRNILTVLGIAAAFVIAFGGWRLTSALLERQETHLLAGKGEAPLVVQEADPPASSKTEEPGGITVDDGWDRTDTLTGSDIYNDKYTDIASLSEEEIAAILATWEMDSQPHPHEPYPGQLKMGEAVAIAEKAMLQLQDAGILPSGVLADIDTTSSLNVWISDEESVTTINTRNSLWTVTFFGDFIDANFTIHAYSGQIWKSSIRSGIGAASEPSSTVKKLLEEFVLNLNLGNTKLIDGTESDSFYCFFEQGFLYAAANYYPIYPTTGEEDFYLYIGLETGEPTLG